MFSTLALCQYSKAGKDSFFLKIKVCGHSVNMYEINIRASPTTVSSILNYLQKLENKIGVHFSIDLN
ncbi:MAG: hypothetical protein ACK559_36350, partial [bacterium]